VEDAKAHTELRSFKIIPSSLKRIVRRGRDKVTTSFLCITNDKKIIRVKPLLITNSKTHNSVKREIRKKLKEMFIKELYNMSLEDMFKSVLSYDIQRRIRGAIKRTYPIRNFEMTFIGIENRKRFVGVEERLVKEAESLGAKEYAIKKEKAKFAVKKNFKRRHPREGRERREEKKKEEHKEEKKEE
jgi:ribosomal protein S3AE